LVLSPIRWSPLKHSIAGLARLGIRPSFAQPLSKVVVEQRAWIKSTALVGLAAVLVAGYPGVIPGLASSSLSTALTSPSVATVDEIAWIDPSATRVGLSARGGERAVEVIEDAAPAEPTTPEASIPTQPHEAFTYSVRTGDTVNRLAAQYGLRSSTIIGANYLDRPDRILPGDKLFIPADDSYQPPQRATVPSSTAGSWTPPRAASSKEEAFIFRMVEGARESQRVTGVPASVTIAQAILETYWGSSFLAREANNYFGIKAHTRPGPAGVVWIDAWEVLNGENVVVPEPFRKYNSAAESLVDHGKFFLENGRYRTALQATNDPREFARRINAAGYATDPAYAPKLITYMDRYNLYQYDLS
jgi:LysM repeat protein